MGHVITERLLRSIIRETLVALGGAYRGRIRRLAHLVKQGDTAALREASALLSSYVPEGSILVPVPSHSGVSTYTKVLADLIARRSASTVLDILSSDARPMLYRSKSEGGDPETLPPFKVSGDVGDRLRGASDVILVDNVVDSGVTFQRAHDALKRRYGVEAWMLSLGVVEHPSWDPDEERVLRSSF